MEAGHSAESGRRIATMTVIVDHIEVTVDAGSSRHTSGGEAMADPFLIAAIEEARWGFAEGGYRSAPSW
jgi:hypothetical protein